MKHDTQDQQTLEKAVDRLCKQQPLRKAPADLYSRVMREVQLRKALPWWRKSFLHWPLMMQVAFVLAALVTAKLALVCTDWVSSNWFASSKVARESASLIQGADTVITVSHSISSHLTEVIPMSWMYAALAIVAVLYLVLFGVGVATYKTLYAAR
ncbi:MAG TPA: hypothetical protein VHL14_05130 [Steroidobacteraceae bacterium]|nr:hypothetical protein [Steroidobacteraceae bacterium]